MAHRLPFDEVQSAVYTRLVTELAALSPSVRLYSWRAPGDAAYPYAVIQRFDSSPIRDKRTSSQLIGVTIAAYCDATSATGINAIANKILSQLTISKLTLTGSFSDIGIGTQGECEQTMVYDEAQDKEIFESIVRFTWIVEDTLA